MPIFIVIKAWGGSYEDELFKKGRSLPSQNLKFEI